MHWTTWSGPARAITSTSGAIQGTKPFIMCAIGWASAMLSKNPKVDFTNRLPSPDAYLYYWRPKWGVRSYSFYLFSEETVATGEVINQLLHHVGAMCIHQLNLLAASSNSLPLGALLGKQHPIEARHFSSICDIMEKAMVNGDSCIIRCILVVFQVSFMQPRKLELCSERHKRCALNLFLSTCRLPQVVFRFFNPQSEQNKESVRRAGLLLWQLLMAPVDHIGPDIQREVCLAIR